jgi:hypothetical protein
MHVCMQAISNCHRLQNDMLSNSELGLQKDGQEFFQVSMELNNKLN